LSTLISKICTGLGKIAGQVQAHNIGILSQNAGPSRATSASPARAPDLLEARELLRAVLALVGQGLVRARGLLGDTRLEALALGLPGPSTAGIQ
jgi:hypothetical protein